MIVQGATVGVIKGDTRRFKLIYWMFRVFRLTWGVRGDLKNGSRRPIRPRINPQPAYQVPVPLQVGLILKGLGSGA